MKLKSRIKEAIRLSAPLSLRIKSYSRKVEMEMEDALKTYIKELGLSEFMDQLAYCFKEMMSNTVKAVSKRIFFESNSIKINSRDDYELGMKQFSESVMERLEEYALKFYDYGYKMDVSLLFREGLFRISVKSNTLMNPWESERVQRNLDLAWNPDPPEELFSKVDHTEGAGLGLLLLVFLIKKMGMGKNNFTIHSTDKETVTAIKIPIKDMAQSSIEELSREIVEALDKLPGLPKNILKLLKMTKEPEPKIDLLSDEFRKDPALTAELLKITNSASNSKRSYITNVQDAIMMIGLDSVRALLYSYATDQLLNVRKKEDFWSHSERVAVYTSRILKNTGRKSSVSSLGYICGLLHDIGDVVLLDSSPTMKRLINDISIKSTASTKTLEFIFSGYSHEKVGEVLARKWHFAPVLIDSIAHHHSPSSVEEEYADIVSAVHIADFLDKRDSRLFSPGQIDDKALSLLGINDLEALMAFDKKS